MSSYSSSLIVHRLVFISISPTKKLQLPVPSTHFSDTVQYFANTPVFARQSAMLLQPVLLQPVLLDSASSSCCRGGYWDYLLETAQEALTMMPKCAHNWAQICDSKNILWAFRIAQNCALSQLSLCTHNPDHSHTNISRFLCNFFSEWPLIFCQHIIHQNPGTLLPRTFSSNFLVTMAEQLPLVQSMI